MKLIIGTITYFLLSFSTILAHEGEGDITIISEADWLGPLVAILIIVVVIFVAKIIKKN